MKTFSNPIWIFLQRYICWKFWNHLKHFFFSERIKKSLENFLEFTWKTLHRTKLFHWIFLCPYSLSRMTSTVLLNLKLNFNSWSNISWCQTVRGVKYSRLLNFSKSFFINLIQFCWVSFWMKEPVISKKTGKPVYGYAGLAWKSRFQSTLTSDDLTIIIIIILKWPGHI